MTTEVIVYTDYVCPFCLLAEKVLRQAIEGKDIQIRWRPFELRPSPVPTLKVEDEYLPSIWKRSVYPMADKLGVRIKLPDISPQPRTEKAFEAFAFAEEHGLGDPFSMVVLTAFFQQGMNIGDAGVLVELGQRIGLDGQALQMALETNAYSGRHQEALKQAREEANITVVPTIIIDEQRYQGCPAASWITNALEALPN